MTKQWEEAVRRGDPSALRQLLSEGADLEARNRYGQTALMIAALNGHSEVVRFLLEEGASPDHTAKFGLSALMLAVLGGHLDIVRALVEGGANLRLRGTGAPGFSGKTALDLAIQHNHPDIARLLGGHRATER